MTAFEDDFLWGGSSEKIESVTVRDIEQMSYLGIQTYRFSLRWSDLFSSAEAWDSYDQIVSACQHYGISPIVAIGEDYDSQDDDVFYQTAKEVFQRYQKQVKYWLLMPGYNQTVLTNQELNQEFFAKNQHHFLAYAKTLRLLKQIIPDSLAGPGVELVPAYAIDDVPENALAKIGYDDTFIHYWLDPYVYGRYPAAAKALLERKRMMPKITQEELALLKQAADLTDFIGISYHRSVAVGYNPQSGIDSFKDDHTHQAIGIPNVFRTRHNKYLSSVRGQIVDPVGLRYGLKQLASRYDLPIIIYENSLNVEEETNGAMLHDPYRIDYVREHLKQLRLAMLEGVKVRSYCMTFTDDVGQSNGLVYARNERRVLKDSYFYYKHLIETKGSDL